MHSFVIPTCDVADSSITVEAKDTTNTLLDAAIMAMHWKQQINAYWYHADSIVNRLSNAISGIAESLFHQPTDSYRVYLAGHGFAHGELCLTKEAAFGFIRPLFRSYSSDICDALEKFTDQDMYKSHFGDSTYFVGGDISLCTGKQEFLFGPLPFYIAVLRGVIRRRELGIKQPNFVVNLYVDACYSGEWSEFDNFIMSNNKDLLFTWRNTPVTLAELLSEVTINIETACAYNEVTFAHKFVSVITGDSFDGYFSEAVDKLRTLFSKEQANLTNFILRAEQLKADEIASILQNRLKNLDNLLMNRELGYYRNALSMSKSKKMSLQTAFKADGAALPKSGVYCVKAQYGDITIIINDDEAIVYDGGPTKQSFGAAYKKYLAHDNIKIKALVVSHHDSDHINGIKYLLQAVISNAIDKSKIANCVVIMNNTLGSFSNASLQSRNKNAEISVNKLANELKLQVSQGTQGVSVEIGKPENLIKLSVIYPPQDKLNSTDFGSKKHTTKQKGADTTKANYFSIVSTLTANSKIFLFTADAQLQDILPLVSGKQLHFMDIPHHGSILSNQGFNWPSSTNYLVSHYGKNYNSKPLPSVEVIANLSKKVGDNCTAYLLYNERHSANNGSRFWHSKDVDTIFTYPNENEIAHYFPF